MSIQVLLVDDEPSLLEITKQFLEQDNEISVSTTDTGKNALEMLDSGHYDAVVSDYQMPEMDGIELLSSIRSCGQNIPFIIFTGRGREDVVIEALNCGADFYLQKGGDPRSQFAELRSKIIHAIERRKAEENLASAYSEMEAAYEKALEGEKALAEKNRLLEESEARFRMLADTTSTAIMLYQDDKWIYANPAAEEISGYSKEELVQMNFWDFVASEFRDAVKERGRKRQEGEETDRHYDFRIVTKQGDEKWVHLQGGNITVHGRPAGIITVTDITALKETEHELRKSEEKYRRIFENLPIGLVQADKEGNVIYLNPQILEILGSPSEEAMREINLLEFPLLQERGISSDIRDAIENRRIVDAERRYVSKWGAEVYMRYKMAPLFKEDEVSGVLAILEDVTPRVQAENALKLANHKFSLLSRITRHDILNDLTAAGGYLELLRMDNPEVSGYYFDRITDAMKSIRKEAVFTRDYQELGANPPLWQDLSAALANAFSQADKPKDVEARVDLPRVEIHADPMLEKALFNIIKNAFQHAQGMTCISLSSEETDEGALKIFIEDDGPGIPEKNKDIIFRSEFQRRYGHGLFLVKEVLDLTGISISENGTAGCGARFEISVPPGRWHPVSE